ncbi:hypothetical protein SY88_17865 [Clostridiales bacterium PH28_bin88]|nr:hypothetical protein SY88_17865 [Clostridiales bacterium PH28_bin88]
MFVEFRIRNVDLKERVFVIEQLINEPNTVLVGEKLPVRADAVIIFSTARMGEKGIEQEERIGAFRELEAGQSGGLILDKEGKVRYIRISKWRNEKP